MLKRKRTESYILVLFIIILIKKNIILIKKIMKISMRISKNSILHETNFHVRYKK